MNDNDDSDKEVGSEVPVEAEVSIDISINDIMLYWWYCAKEASVQSKTYYFCRLHECVHIFEVVAVCLRNTKPGMSPYQNYLIDASVKKWKIVCSCKGVSNGRYKHSVAALLHLFTYGVE